MINREREENFLKKVFLPLPITLTHLSKTFKSYFIINNAECIGSGQRMPKIFFYPDFK